MNTVTNDISSLLVEIIFVFPRVNKQCTNSWVIAGEGDLSNISDRSPNSRLNY